MTASVALTPPAVLADDILKGVKDIAKFTGLTERSVYHIAAAGRLPVFKLGATICARKSTILAWIQEQEAKAGQAVAQ
ncbi:helix-turn-helix domain-containing protein [Azospirillum sp. Sh1]|nr:helix-turn-helix domain-containing protein [Azospirillum sp. Sh1]